MKRALLVLALLCASARAARGASCLPVATGVTHYFCDCGTGADPSCVVGNDASSGTSASSPWRTWSKFNTTYNAAAAGDQMLLCKGGAFSEGGSNNFVNSNSTAASRVSVGSYTSPSFTSTAKPKVYGSTGRGIDFADGGLADHEEGATWDGLELIGPGISTATFDAVYIFNDIDYVTMCNMDIHDWASGVDMTGANSPNPGADGHNAHWTFIDNNIHDNNGQGHYGADNDLLIEGLTRGSCKFANNGTARAIFNHNVYLGDSGSGPDSNITITNCDLYQSAMVAGTCQSTSLVMHGVHSNVTISNNDIHEDIGAVSAGCWGIGINGGYGTTETFTNVIVRGNTITNVGGSSMSLGSIVGGLIENNAIVNLTGSSPDGITSPDQEGPEDTPISAVVIRNNSIVQDGGRGIVLGTEGTGHGSNNNAVRLGAAGTCFTFNLAAAAYGSGIDYNDCFVSGGTGNHWQNTQSLATWNGASGFDGHSKTTDPAFLSIVAPYNLLFLNTSPLYNAGSTAIGPTIDIVGVTRPQSTSTDIGAYELPVGTTPPSSVVTVRRVVGVWMCLALAFGLAWAAHRRRDKALAAQAECHHLTDEPQIAALREMGDDGTALMLTYLCKGCGEPLFLTKPNERKKDHGS